MNKEFLDARFTVIEDMYDKAVLDISDVYEELAKETSELYRKHLTVKLNNLFKWKFELSRWRQPQ